ncbi:RSP_2648 family PIN domain-containing protein [Thalassorhabdomicrobium marinisediminis]|uniref:PIN domain-containing protein n=1 Tax=Thalassorhabdomicrobium marinisediminis TaxID=2170577 RepID=A0A2T7G101_9RHOB|nr:PIN domain-containing protein [Thalassorhabdomicrobium marinisediminis]PVA08095.1 PIN domain-containing protein [Thalassorhabdomicrobium marinisediminis]
MRVLIDACVLYPTVMREVVLGVAEAGLFTPRWSPRILEEWARAARKIGPEGETIARGEIAALSLRFPRALVPEPQGLARHLRLPDADDVHVLAAAVGASCDAIMTVNAKDFPRNILAEEGVERIDPDGFLWRLGAEHPEVVRGVADNVLAEARRLSGAPWEMRKLMRKARLPRLGKWLAG